jgi:hypothetical protein
MNSCSASSASASVSVAMKSMSAIWPTMSVAPRPPGFEKWLATRFLSERALPTYRTLRPASLKM